MSNAEPLILDLSGLPESVIQQVHEARQLAVPVVEEPRMAVLGRLAHLNLEVPSFDELQAERSEMWAQFPRKLPDTTK